MSTGREGGSYYLIGKRLQRTMATEHEVWIDVLTSRGSLANLARLDDPSSPVGLTLTQADALNRYLQSHPEFADEFIVLGDAGKECVFLIAGSAGSVTTAANLSVWVTTKEDWYPLHECPWRPIRSGSAYPSSMTFSTAAVRSSRAEVPGCPTV